MALMLFQQVLVQAQAPRALVVIAHPDDESLLAVTLYKLVKEQQGTADIFVITNGEAGYRYSTLAEQYYGCTLGNAADARKSCPLSGKRSCRKRAAYWASPIITSAASPTATIASTSMNRWIPVGMYLL